MTTAIYHRQQPDRMRIINRGRYWYVQEGYKRPVNENGWRTIDWRVDHGWRDVYHRDTKTSSHAETIMYQRLPIDITKPDAAA